MDWGLINSVSAQMEQQSEGGWCQMKVTRAGKGRRPEGCHGHISPIKCIPLQTQKAFNTL